MSDDAIRKLVLATIEDETTREGGTMDMCREAALNIVMEAIEVKFRNMRAELGLTNPWGNLGGGLNS